MKITIFSESSNDEAVIRILVESILGEEIEEVPPRNQLRSRGVDSFLDLIPNIINATYYQTESEAIVLVCDSNDKPVHVLEHDEKGNEDSLKCRYCIVKRKVDETLKLLNIQPHREMIKVAVGVAVPAIEAWLVCDGKLDVSEEKWISKSKGENVKYDRVSLKQILYGNRPPKSKKIEKATEEANKISQNLELLEQKFPQGFSNLFEEIKSWK